jgi:hypothetical protein
LVAKSSAGRPCDVRLFAVCHNTMVTHDGRNSMIEVDQTNE